VAFHAAAAGPPSQIDDLLAGNHHIEGATERASSSWVARAFGFLLPSGRGKASLELPWSGRRVV